MPVSFEELAGSPTFTVTRDNFKGTRRFKIAWTDRYAFATELVGTGGAGVGGIGAASPSVFPGLSNTACVNAEVGPFVEKNTNSALTDHTTEHNTYDYAEVVATYETLPLPSGSAFDPTSPSAPSGTVIEWNKDHAGEYMQLPSRGFRWTGVSGNITVPEDVHPGVIVPCTDYTATWHYVKRPPITAIRNLRGKVNQSDFRGAIEKSLLFMGARESFSRDLSGNETSTLTYLFKEKVIHYLATGVAASGWINFFREADTASPGDVSDFAELTPSPYPSGDFSALFVYEP